MRKITALLMALLIVFAAAAGAGEEENLQPDLYDLYDVSGESPRWLGVAISAYEGILLVPTFTMPDNLSDLSITDGKNVWAAEAAAPDATETLAMIVYDVDTVKPAIGMCRLVDAGSGISPANCYVLTGDENMSRINRTVYSIMPTTWRGMSCLLVSMSGPAELGSPLLTTEGRLAGIAVAEWTEGRNRMLFLSPEGLYQSMSEALDVFTGANGLYGPPTGFEATADGNVVTFRWADMQMPETKEGEELYLVVTDTKNTYLTYYRIDQDTECTMVLTPGRTYNSGILASAGTPDRMPDSTVETVLPAAEKLTDYGFVSKVCAVAEAPEGGLKGDELPVPVTEVTEELLRSGRAYFYSSTTYQVTETIEDIPLLITLTDPNGQNYRYLSGWLYDPSYMNDDTWAVSFTDTGLLSFLNESGYPKGTYEIDFYIGGRLADSCVFELK